MSDRQTLVKVHKAVRARWRERNHNVNLCDDCFMEEMVLNEDKDSTEQAIKRLDDLIIKATVIKWMIVKERDAK